MEKTQAKGLDLHIDKVKYESAKSDYKEELCNAKAKYEDELVDALPTNPKKFYNYTRSFISSSSTIDSLVVDGTKVYDDSVKAKALNDFFGSVLVKETPLNHSLTIYDDKPSETLRFNRFTVSEVAKKMKSLKANKGSGPDGIHVNVLRNTSAFAEPLCELFNDSVCSGILPQDWKDGNITPLHKKGSKQTCSNYRPVTLTSQVVKLLERLVQDQILKHVKTTTLYLVTNTVSKKNVHV